MKQRPPSSEYGRRALIKYNATRHLLPKCGARAKSTGEPCTHVALANGRCRWHGGRSTAGKNWGKRQFNSDDPVKIDRKLSTLERREQKRLARVTAMTPEERQRYARWRNTHKPGPKSARAADRERRRQDRDARGFMEKVMRGSADSQDGILDATVGIEAQLPAVPASDYFCESNGRAQIGDDMMDELSASEIDGHVEETELRRRIRREGALAAYEAALAVCRDPKAPAQAKATASATIFRAAGFFEKREDGDDKPEHEMTLAEINARLAKLRRQSGAPASAEDDAGVFD